MANDAPWPWAGRALYLGLCATLILAALLPIGGAVARPGPDLILALTIAFLLRRPDFVPPLSVVGVFLIADLALQRPPGLGALGALLLTEALRARAPALQAQGFGAEWLAAGAAIAAYVIGIRLFSALMLLPLAALGPTLAGLGWTIVAYPAVALFSWWPCRVRRPPTAMMDSRLRKR